FRGGEGVRDAGCGCVGRSGRPDGGGQPDGAECVRDRPGQEGEADPGLSDDDGPQLRRGAAGDRLAAADGGAQGGDAGAVEAGRQGDHLRLGLERRGEGAVRRVGGAEALHPHRPAAGLTDSDRAAEPRPAGGAMARWTPDPSFYPSPRLAMEAPAERLAYVALLEPDQTSRPDALGVLDLEPGSSTYGQVVSTVELGTGDEVHHFGWNACSAALCPTAPRPHVERRYLVVPGLKSS